MLNALECVHVCVHAVLQLVRPTQTARHFRLVFVQRDLARGVALLHAAVENGFAVEDVVVHLSDDLLVKRVEVLLDERALHQRAVDVDEAEDGLETRAVAVSLRHERRQTAVDVFHRILERVIVLQERLNTEILMEFTCKYHLSS